MKAQWINEGDDLMVTGTLDVEEAKAFVSDDDDMAEFVSYANPVATRGQFVPCPRSSYFSHMWHTSENGRCKAVTFYG